MSLGAPASLRNIPTPSSSCNTFFSKRSNQVVGSKFLKESHAHCMGVAGTSSSSARETISPPHGSSLYVHQMDFCLHTVSFPLKGVACQSKGSGLPCHGLGLICCVRELLVASLECCSANLQSCFIWVFRVQKF